MPGKQENIPHYATKNNSINNRYVNAVVGYQLERKQTTYMKAERICCQARIKRLSTLEQKT